MKKLLPLLLTLISINFGYGQLETKSLTTNKGIFIGFYEYLPAEAKSNPSKKFPTIIFLHGLGERGNGTTQLSAVLKHGIPKNINQGHDMKFYWNGKWESFIVLAPQLSSNYGSWQNFYVEEMIQYGIKNLPIDPDRIHLTGLSLGGGGTWSYADRTHENAKNLASIAPVCATYKEMDMSPITDANLPVWAFHAKDDKTVSVDRTYKAIDNIMKLNPAVIPVTTYWETGGHGIWSRAYDTEYSWSNPNIYEWMLAQNKRLSVNKRPVAKAGSDFSAALSTSATLNGSQSTDTDGKIVRFVWKKVSGPKGGEITTPVSTDGITKTTLLQEVGTYVYELKVIDDRAEYTVDQVQVKVSSENINLSPTVDAGKNIHSKTNYVTLKAIAKDEDGEISKINWRQLQGPSNASIESPKALITKVSNLKNGNYVFRIEVWDNHGAKSTDDIGVVIEIESQEAPDPTPVEPRKPSIYAGKNQYPSISEIILNGEITDPSKIITKINWRQLQGPAASTIEKSSSLNTKISKLQTGNYIFRLEAWDKDGVYYKDDIGIVVKLEESQGQNQVTEETNRKPIANAGKNQYVNQSTTILDGSASSDPDDNIKTITWRQLKGPNTANFMNKNSLKTEISGLQSGFYIFRIQLTDEFDLTSFDDIGITVTLINSENKEPYAYAGKNQYLYTSKTVLDGTSSSDEDGFIKKYNWRKLKGPSSFHIESPSSPLTNLTSLVPGFYIFRLEVWDDKNKMNFDDIGITVYESDAKSQTLNIAENETLSYPSPKTQALISEQIEVSVFPNPAKSSISVKYESESKGPGQINIYNSTGKLINSIRINKTSDLFQQSISISNLTNGLYYLDVVIGNTGKKSVSFIKN